MDEVWDLWKLQTLEDLAKAQRGALDEIAVRIEVGSEDALRREVEEWVTRLGEQGVDHEFDVF